MAIHQPSSRSQCSQNGRGGRSSLPHTTAPPTRGVRTPGFSFFSPSAASPPPSAAGGSAAAAPRESLTFIVHVTTSNSTIWVSPSVSIVPSKISARGTNARCDSTSETCAAERPAAASAAARFSAPARLASSPAPRTLPLRASASATFSSTCGSCSSDTVPPSEASLAASLASFRAEGATACVTHCENSRSDSAGRANA